MPTLTPGADRLSWKTTHHFRRMLPNRALAAYANALKNVDMTDVEKHILAPAGNTMGGNTMIAGART
jgi:hypothetical protein